MTDPLKSQHDFAPQFNPTLYSSSKDAKDEKKAAATYAGIYGGAPIMVDGDAPDDPPPADVSTPTLTTAFTTAPDFVPLANNNNGGDSDSDEQMAGGAFAIQLGGLHSAEQTCLDATGQAVNGYTDLRTKVDAAAASDTLFGQKVGTVVWHSKVGGKAGQETPDNLSKDISWDQFDDEGKAFAEQIVPSMHLLLRGVANALELMGQFNALLNNAGQMYANADASCAFPE
ncbi:hypothetical protein AB0E08_17775 [Streptomyces sp. NPDC048281]|uniref:hypothetical protein n=1 Tax=Streptomyces sp. NPDC048281 TaxID=3154715 RepID=UPI00343DB93D